MAINKGFIKDWQGNHILPITRGELVLDVNGNIALASDQFLAGSLTDANGNGLPGLITAAERAMLNGNTSGLNLKDLYDKLKFINEGLYVKNTAVNFYNSSGTQTPIKIDSPEDGQLDLKVNSNTITFALKELSTSPTEISAFLRSITVDKYGRVTDVSGSNLNNADIPATLTGKVLENCTTSSETIPNDNTAIVNKKYVDDKLKDISTMATGALKFGGSVGTSDLATLYLVNANINKYYKATGEFILSASQVHDSTLDVSIKTGDTLIVYQETSTEVTFVHIPSGDDITAITVKQGSNNAAINSQVGHVTFNFQSPFTVTKDGTNTALISIPPASSTLGGYLTLDDWKRFNSYASQSGISYTGNLSPEAGIYEIGVLNVNGSEYTIYGKNYESNLSLENGATDASNPILKFTETGKDDVEITLKGYRGVITKKNGNIIEIGADIQAQKQNIPQDSAREVEYITVTNGYQIGVQIGSSKLDGTVDKDGLTDYSQFNALVNRVSRMFEVITYSLNDAANENQYRYGNDKLKAAVAITI